MSGNLATMTGSLLEKARSFLFTRKHAYQLVFNDENVFTKTVLKDLAKFCRAYDTTFHADPRLHAALEGRREVWLRIQNHLKLNPEELWERYGRKDLE
jgi:hypothetical protein